MTPLFKGSPLNAILCDLARHGVAAELRLMADGVTFEAYLPSLCCRLSPQSADKISLSARDVSGDVTNVAALVRMLSGPSRRKEDREIATRILGPLGAELGVFKVKTSRNTVYRFI